MAEEADPLLTRALELYAGLPGEFTAARNAAVAQAKRDGDKELAASIGGLRRPSNAAWAVGLLVRREAEQVDQALGLAESLRVAAEALDGDELRALTRQRRQLTAALTTRARQLAQEEGVRLSGAVAEQVEGTLTAAMMDADAARALSTGLLVGALNVPAETPYDELVAVPAALGTRVAPQEAAGLRVVRTDEGTRREAAREQAQEALDEAESTLAAAEEELGAHDREIEELQGRALQLRSEVDELQRRIGELEETAETVEEQVDQAESARADARAERDEARAARDEAAESWAALGQPGARRR